MRPGKLRISATVMTSTVLILIGASLIKYKANMLGTLIFIVGVLAAIIGFIEFVNYFAKRDKYKPIYEVLISVVLIAAGILISIFSHELQPFAFVVVSIMLLLQAMFDFVKFVRIKWKTDLFFAILKTVLGTILLVATFASGVELLLAIVGHLMIAFSIVFIIVDTF